MAPRIPEGYSFVPRRSGVNVALLLLEAAEEVGADRVQSVRTTTNGYNVHSDVAAQYVETNGEEAAEGIIDSTASETPDAGEITEQDLIDGLTSWGNQEADDDEDEDETEEEEGDPNGQPVTPVTPVEPATGDSGSSTEEPAPLGVTAENTNAEIDDYASKLTPPVDVSKAKNKTEKIDILEHARTAPKTDTVA